MNATTAGPHPEASGRRLWPGDVALAVFVLVVQVGGTAAAATHQSRSAPAVGLIVLGIGALALLGRRRWPVPVLTVAFVTTLVYWTARWPRGPIFVSLIVALVLAVVAGHRRAGVVTCLAGYFLFQWAPKLIGTHRGPTMVSALGLAAWLLVLLAGAELLRARAQRLAATLRTREEEARRVASEERLRIARELHDVLAHHISLINVQAATALHLQDRQPQRAAEALATIKDVSKEALVELRSVLGVLRQVDEELPRAPAPSLERVSELTARMGLDVRVERLGKEGPLPSSIDQAAFRIVQEGLTNVARHSEASVAAVRIERGESDLVVEVADEGPARPTGNGTGRESGSGTGIRGMRERAAALGGHLEAGPQPGGGFRVRAWLPVGVSEA